MAANIFRILERDHARFRELLRELDEARTATERDQLLSELEVEVTTHSEAEEAVVYACAEQFDDLRRDAFAGAEEHALVSRLLRELFSMNAEDVRWQAKRDVLADLLDKHIEDEEGPFFDELRARLSDAQAERLAEEFIELKERRRYATASPPAEP